MMASLWLSHLERSANMTGLTDFITESSWADTFLIWFVIVDDAYTALEAHYGGWRPVVRNLSSVTVK